MLSLSGQARQGRAGQSGHQNSLGELEQPAGIPQRGDAAGAEQGRQHGIHHQTELIDRRSEYDRNQQAPNPHHRRMTWPPLGADQQPQTAQGRDLPDDLQYAAEHDAVGQAEDRLGQETRHPQGAADDSRIQQHRGKGRGAEMPPGVAYPGRQGEQPDPEQIGKGEFGQGSRKDQGVRVKARRKKANQGGGTHNPESGQQQQDPARDPEQSPQHGLGFCPGVMDHILGDHRDDGRVAGPFADQATQEIGNAKGDKKGIGNRAGPKQAGDEHVADQPCHSAEQGQDTDLACGPDYPALLAHHHLWGPAAGWTALIGRLTLLAGVVHDRKCPLHTERRAPRAFCREKTIYPE